MVKIIVAYPSDEKCAQFSTVLEEAGFSVFRRCTSGSEVRRALDQCCDGIVLCASRLPDCTVDELAWDLGSRALILATGRPQQLELCEHPDVFRLPTPCSRGELGSAVSMLSQLHQMRLPRRSADEKQMIAQAKNWLMVHNQMTEPEAHRYLQQQAMNSGRKMAECAANLLAGISDKS